MTTSTKQFAQVITEFAERGVGVAHMDQLEYDQLELNPHLRRYRLEVIYDGALDESTRFLVSPPDVDVIERLVEVVALEVSTDYDKNPDTSLGWSVEVYEVDASGDTAPEGASPILSARHD